MIGLAYLCRRFVPAIAGVVAWGFAPAHGEEPLPAARSLSLVAWNPKGWVIDLEKDGSGAIRHGSSVLEPATFPAGTVSFPQVLEWVETRRRVGPGQSESVGVVIDRSAPGKSEALIEESRPMAGEWEVIGRQILPRLHARDVRGTLDLLRAHPLIKEPGELTKIAETAAMAGAAKREPQAGEPATGVDMKSRAAGWDIRVNPDGSGSIQWGSTIGDRASFPKGTVSFEDLVAAARSRKVVTTADPQSVYVLVRTIQKPSGTSENRAMSREWESIGRQILQHLEVWTGFEPRVAELLAKYPLVMDPEALPVFHKPTGSILPTLRPISPEKKPGD